MDDFAGERKDVPSSDPAPRLRKESLLPDRRLYSSLPSFDLADWSGSELEPWPTTPRTAPAKLLTREYSLFRDSCSVVLLGGGDPRANEVKPGACEEDA
jgi:hypothetical protein